ATTRPGRCSSRGPATRGIRTTRADPSDSARDHERGLATGPRSSCGPSRPPVPKVPGLRARRHSPVPGHAAMLAASAGRWGRGTGRRAMPLYEVSMYIDARGGAPLAPIVRAEQALRSLEPGSIVEVLTSDAESIPAFRRGAGPTACERL